MSSFVLWCHYENNLKRKQTGTPPPSFGGLVYWLVFSVEKVFSHFPLVAADVPRRPRRHAEHGRTLREAVARNPAILSAELTLDHTSDWDTAAGGELCASAVPLVWGRGRRSVDSVDDRDCSPTFPGAIVQTGSKKRLLLLSPTE